ncbi:VOC family protein [Planococcus salinus]|uniref:VOC family protein n=1 Tax=Planococcus salinus TaxID=1848460 RepID=A0A3M8P5Q9_9BACL|nr:VOC family protein [Planococcus salinus]RNF38731.1 VOC family protein [Planococcus salinus]
MEQQLPKITPFLMFAGRAEEAMKYYTSIFEDAEITSIVHNGDGTVMQATFKLNGQLFMCIDSPIEHDFSFTPAISLYVTCNTQKEIEQAFEQLSDGGEVLMTLDAYPFSEKFGWVNDKFGVSWQLNLQSTPPT